MNDADFMDLVEKEISGEISEQERKLLRAYVEEHEEARDAYKKILETSEVLSKVGDLEPPADLKHRIMESIDLGRYEAQRRVKRPSFWESLLRPRLRLAYAFVLGVVVGLLVYSQSGKVRMADRSTDARHLYGTIAGSDDVKLNKVDEVSVDLPEVTGKISLIKTGNLLVIEADLRPDHRLDFMVEFDPDRIRFEGFGPPEGVDMRVVTGYGSVTTSGAGEGWYVLARTEPVAETARLGVKLLVSSELVYQCEFSVSEHD